VIHTGGLVGDTGELPLIGAVAGAQRERVRCSGRREAHDGVVVHRPGPDKVGVAGQGLNLAILSTVAYLVVGRVANVVPCRCDGERAVSSRRNLEGLAYREERGTRPAVPLAPPDLDPGAGRRHLSGDLVIDHVGRRRHHRHIDNALPGKARDLDGDRVARGDVGKAERLLIKVEPPIVARLRSEGE